MSATHKLSSWRQVGDIELIPPTAEEFSVYGSAKTIAAAKRWAIRGHYMLVRGVAPCAHGLLGLRNCPAKCTRIEDFDHTEVWVNLEEWRPKAFVLSAPYPHTNTPSATLRSYAEHHGLRIDHFPTDGWYGYGTIPIRLTLQEHNYLGALEEMLVLLNHCVPTKWPEESSEDVADDEDPPEPAEALA